MARSRCPHGRQRSKFKECKGTGICEQPVAVSRFTCGSRLAVTAGFFAVLPNTADSARHSQARLQAPRHLRGRLLITPCNFTLQNRICYVVVLCADMSGNDPTRVEWRSASWCSENMNTVKFQQAIVRRTGLTSEGRVGDNRSARNPTRCFYARWRGRWMRLAAQ